jgi:hypothetical protein
MKKYYLIFYGLTFVLIVVFAIYGIENLPKLWEPIYDSTEDISSRNVNIVLLWILQLIIIGITYFVAHLLEIKYKKNKTK